ncbi:MAG: SUMF1/EgtB/PvdO family nonheme iron enzyme [Fibrobacter sp.]|uniref:formylglycine-generating enzyme family protein n=1 Tax=Fibrobacter sp. TaxID=35828 RepID=UPI0025BB0177|nr:SUMF1/EgtB/PvdO family nonheme iron enzyme [Fibrobacter sp.]MBQ9225355.1 SUMF1/EgtB/PvdO family nonheme iron enzyme [Fibrobacter sp.]
MNENNENTQESKNASKRKKKNIAVLVIMFLLLVCLFIVQCQLDKIKQEAQQKAQETELEARQKHILDSLRRLEQAKADSLANAEAARIADSLRLADSARVADSMRVADSLASLKPEINKDSLRHVRDSIKHVRDSVAAADKARNDSLAAIADSLAKVEKARLDSLEKKRVQDSIRAADQTPPSAEIVPPSGRYYDPIKLKVKCDEIKCKTFLSIGDTLNPVEAGKAVEYNKTGSVFYFAEDSVGNRTKWEEAKYDMASDNVCGKNAYPVPVGGKTVCVDAYEYPNEADATPRDMVSQEQAASLCEQAGKHLCSIDEWQAACRGKDKTRFSYGDGYKQNKCNTNTKAMKRSGRKEQCRSWFGMYDMNGNLWEWTSTKSKDHPNMFLVAGGAWNTNNESKCTDSKFSFYPQNQYPSVGFRCCK